MRCDVTEWDDQQALVQRALDAYGRVDVAFANAGFGGARGFKAGTPEEWKEMVLTNVYGAALTIRAAYDALRRVQGPHRCSRHRSPAAARYPGSFYSVTKHAVTAMGEAARQDFNDTGVRVTLIEPGMVDTPFFDTPPRSRRCSPTTSPAPSSTPCSSRRTSTSTRSSSGRRLSRRSRAVCT